MSKILIVEKNGEIKETSIKNLSVNELYKKVGLKSADNFKEFHTWKIQNDNITLFSKCIGRAGQENKYDFPPPEDNTLFFGSCILIMNLDKDKNTCDNLTKKNWEKMYEFLFGGFEDLNDESEESDDEDVDSDASFTKDGYMKDGFIVDDESVEDIKPRKKIEKKETKPRKMSLFEKIESIPTEYETSQELSEEEYD
jgi:hypothetical protein